MIALIFLFRVDFSTNRVSEASIKFCAGKSMVMVIKDVIMFFPYENRYLLSCAVSYVKTTVARDCSTAE